MVHSEKGCSIHLDESLRFLLCSVIVRFSCTKEVKTCPRTIVLPGELVKDFLITYKYLEKIVFADVHKPKRTEISRKDRRWSLMLGYLDYSMDFLSLLALDHDRTLKQSTIICRSTNSPFSTAEYQACIQSLS